MRPAVIDRREKSVLHSSISGCARSYRPLRQGMLILATMLCSSAHSAEPSIAHTERETYTCEDEQSLFESWSRVAGSMSESELLQQLPEAQVKAVQASDGRILKGLQIPATPKAKDALLVIPGNAWSTKGFSSIASLFPSDKLTIFLFDFRGYGLSKPGNPTMSAILSDYKDIARWLQAQRYRNLYLYAYSFGGVIALNAFPAGSPFRRIVLDSVPARPSEMGFKCKPSYDPIEKIQNSCQNITFMHGTSDWVVPRSYTQPLVSSISACGGVLDIDESRGHPFQIEWQSSRVKRIDAMVRHLNLEVD